MAGTTQTFQAPEDLRSWISEKTLLTLVFEAMHHDQGGTSRPLPVGNSRVLMTLALFSYACGTYASEEIAAALPADATLRYLAASSAVDGHEIRRVRRHHRKELRSALVELLRLCWEQQARITAPELTDRPLACTTDIRRALTHEAERRLDKAVRADSMALDV